MTRTTTVAIVLVFAASCSGGGRAGDPTAVPTECGLPTPEPNLNPEILPAAFLPGDSFLISTRRHERGFLVALGAPFPIDRAIEIFRDAAEGEGYEIVSEDNEGFEAELYMQRRKLIGAIQLRSSYCREASFVVINVFKSQAPL
ncbi:MAG: hypothetical protein ABR505_02120 [Actinomycetota bacterium]